MDVTCLNGISIYICCEYHLAIVMKQIKSTLAIVVALCSIFAANAQSFNQGKSVVSLGYGFGNFTQAVFKVYKDELNFTYKGFGPMHLKYEYGVSPKMGIGVSMNYNSANVSYTDTNEIVPSSGQFLKTNIKYNSYSILARINYHFGTSAKVDPYMGFGVGYRNASYKYSDNDPQADANFSLSNPLKFGFEATIGCRFYFTPNIGMYVETGVAKSLFQFGLCAGF